jgi:hypothetical protein
MGIFLKVDYKNGIKKASAISAAKNNIEEI